MAERYDLAIVGVGSAGVVAADFAATLGLRVCAIERDRIGGDCLWTGCVPSKALLSAARAAHAMRSAGAFGIEPVEPSIDTAKVFANIRDVQAQIAATDDSPDRLRDRGMDVRLGEPGVLEGPHAVRVGTDVVRAAKILLCPGSRPAVPPIPGLAAAGYLTSESVWEIERAPGSMVVLGAGPIAMEMAQGFGRLGVEMTVLERADRVLARDEPELAARVAARLRAEGATIELGTEADRVSVEDGQKVVHAGDRTWRAQEIVGATGRAPNTEDLGLEAIGLAPGPRGIETDARSRTRVPSVHAVGDVSGGYQFTHAAAADAAAAVRDMFFPGRGRAAELVPWCTFTDPELAHAGLTSAEAREQHGSDDVETRTFELERSDRARADRETDGALVAVTHRQRLVGAHVLAPAAGELIGELTLAISRGLKLSELSSLVHVYPTYSTAIAQLAAESAFERAGRLRWLIRSAS